MPNPNWTDAQNAEFAAIMASFKVTHRGELDEAGYDALASHDRALRLNMSDDPPCVVDMHTREWWTMAPAFVAAVTADRAAEEANPQCEPGDGPALEDMGFEESKALFFKLLGERHPSRGPPPVPSGSGLGSAS
ncbi:uncharacterized protein LOC62_04G005496 [Vanrija pseudolonga]|uniref:Uncharacterized protein n=1 Tax=Vanrija pseudolonga TaxID=143232 RepID=A0AAF0YCK3_9TREE|nr:hypothetical protein LOC62_04G005496 [Vanrija pseudolonga]